MDGHRRPPSNMSQMCRLCLTEDAITLPIFGEEESSTQSQIPLSFRIMACVSVEVTQGDGLPTVICEKCLNHVNSWHDFKQVCDVSQATLKEWQNNCREVITMGDKDIYIKQEPLDEEQEDEDVMEIIDQDVDEQYMVDYIKQEVDDSFEEERQDCCSVESIHEDSSDPLCVPESCISAPLVAKDFHSDEVEIIPIPQAGDVSHLRITDIKTESGSVEAEDEVTVTATPCEGRLLRSVLQGKTRASYHAKGDALVEEGLQELTTVKPYQCQTCAKSFAYNYLLRRHEKVHMTDKNTCGFCQKGFSSHGDLVQHVQLWNEGGTVSKPYSCDHCGEKFACRTQYLMHADGSDGRNCIANNDHIVTEDGSYKCEECLEDFPSVMLLRLHMRKEHLHFSCHKCNKVFSNGVSLSNHLRSHSSSAMRHYCEKCPMSYTTPDLLKKHEKTHLKEAAAMAAAPGDVPALAPDPAAAPEGEPTESPGMDVEVPEVEQSLYVPIKQEPPPSPEAAPDPAPAPEDPAPPSAPDGPHPHACQLCGEGFPTLVSLRFHLKGTHLHFQCHRCPKVYGSGVALSNHLRSHSSMAPSSRRHKCPVCMKAFSSVDMLLRHKASHSAPPRPQALRSPLEALLDGRPDVTATFEGGDVGGGEGREALAIARRTCAVCGALLASASALERHMTTHSRDKVFTCKVCHASMSYASSLQKHYRVMHGMVVELKSIQKNPVYRVREAESPRATEGAGAEAEAGAAVKVETFTRSGRRILSFNRTLQTVAPPEMPPHAPFECKVCHRGFQYRSFLLKHLKVHEKQSAASQTAVACQICFKTFPDAKTLNNHKGVHTRFKHFGCSVCGKSFNGLNAWRKHERMHQKGYIYSCKLCGKKFISKSELHNHKKMHIKLKIYTCSVCKNSYHSSSALGKHKRRHGHYSASAEETDLSDVEVVEPLVTPDTKPPKAASRAPSIVRSSAARQLPKTTTHFPSGKRRPFCALCSKAFSTLKALRRHKLMHDRAAKPLSVDGTSAAPPVPETSHNMCLTCNRAFPDHTSLVRHKGWHTRRFNFPLPPAPADAPDAPSASPLDVCVVKLEPDPAPPPPVECGVCFRVLGSPAALDAHMRTHAPRDDKGGFLSAPRRLACKICKKPFDSKKALITHIGWHSRGSHSLKPLLAAKGAAPRAPAERVSCAVCHKYFSSALMLSRHKKLHTRKLLSSIKIKAAEGNFTPDEEEGNFTCPVCLRVFKYVKYLNLHMRLHTGEKKFKCNMCNQAYHRSGSLWKHKRTHHAFKVFCCHICQKRFGLKTQLTKHMETHGVHSVAPSVVSKAFTVYACSFCDKTFAKVEKLRQHERIHRA